MEALKNTSMMLVLAAIFYGAYQMFVSDPTAWKQAEDPSAEPQLVYRGEATAPETSSGGGPTVASQSQRPASEAGIPAQPAWNNRANGMGPQHNLGHGQSATPSHVVQNPAGNSDGGFGTASHANQDLGSRSGNRFPNTLPPDALGTVDPRIPNLAANPPASNPGTTQDIRVSTDDLPPLGQRSSANPVANVPHYGNGQGGELRTDRIGGDTYGMEQGVAPTAGTSPDLDSSGFNDLMPIRDQPSSPASGASAANGDRLDQLAAEMEVAGSEIQNGQHTAALRRLSPWYNYPVGERDRETMMTWLDNLAAEVIYSTRHTLSEAYTIREGDTLEKVARLYRVTPQILSLINFSGQTVDPGQPLRPGAQLKVVPGPFRAVVDLQAGELTVFLNELFAGRFAFRVGKSGPLDGGTHTVSFVTADGISARDGNQTLEPLAAGNPFGRFCLVVGKEVVMHSPGNNSDGSCLEFNETDMQHLQAILGRGSEVKIVR